MDKSKPKTHCKKSNEVLSKKEQFYEAFKGLHFGKMSLIQNRKDYL